MINTQELKTVHIAGKNYPYHNQALVACFHNKERKWYQLGTFSGHPILIETAIDFGANFEPGILYQFNLADLFREIKQSPVFDGNTVLYVVDFIAQRIYHTSATACSIARNNLQKFGINVYDYNKFSDDVDCNEILRKIPYRELVN